MFDFLFFFNSLLLGIGLAMDAFSVSLANGLNEPCMPKKKGLAVAATFGIFQGAMPFIGWVCVHTMVELFSTFEKFIPWIALALLGFIGGKMLAEGIGELRNHEGTNGCGCSKPLGITALLVQGVATSIDALSVGFTIADYDLLAAIVAVLIIALVTFLICFAGIILGKHFGTALSGKSSVFGGVILIFIGIEIFVTSFF